MAHFFIQSIRSFRKYFKRGFALVLAVVYTLSTHAGSVEAAVLHPPAPKAAERLDLNSFRLPPRIGSVEQVSQTHSAQTVFLIPDAHSIPEAQKNISKILQYLSRAYGVSTVGLEGASGDLDAAIFKTYPEKNRLKAFFSSLLAKGEIPGSVLALLSKDGAQAHYSGVEDWKVYEEAVALYLQALHSQPAVLAEIQKQAEALETQKKTFYSAQLLEIDRAEIDFRQDAGKLLQLLKVLSRHGVPDRMTRLHDLTVSLQWEEEKFKEEISRIVHVILRLRMTDAQKIFTAKLQDYRTGRLPEAGFLSFLSAYGKKQGIDLSLSREARRAARSWRRLTSLKSEKLFEELETYISDIKRPFLTSDSIRRLDQETRELGLLTKLTKLEVTYEEWKEIKKETSDRRQVTRRSFFMAHVTRHLSLHRAFYKNSEKRDEIFFEKLTHLMSSPHVFRRGSLDTLAFVGGGFHVPALAKKFSKAGMNVVVLQPKIEELPSKNIYQEHMRGNVSWKKALLQDQNQVCLYDSFLNYFKKTLMDSSAEPRGVLLKAWQDEIIRELAARGEIEKAGKYHRQIRPEADSQALLPALLQKRFDAFAIGMKHLQSENKLTRENIFHLLQNAHVIAALSGPSLIVPRSEFRMADPKSKGRDNPKQESEEAKTAIEERQILRNHALLAIQEIQEKLKDKFSVSLAVTRFFIRLRTNTPLESKHRSLLQRLQKVYGSKLSAVLPANSPEDRLLQAAAKRLSAEKEGSSNSSQRQQGSGLWMVDRREAMRLMGQAIGVLTGGPPAWLINLPDHLASLFEKKRFLKLVAKYVLQTIHIDDSVLDIIPEGDFNMHAGRGKVFASIKAAYEHALRPEVESWVEKNFEVMEKIRAAIRKDPNLWYSSYGELSEQERTSAEKEAKVISLALRSREIYELFKMQELDPEVFSILSKILPSPLIFSSFLLERFADLRQIYVSHINGLEEGSLEKVDHEIRESIRRGENWVGSGKEKTLLENERKEIEEALEKVRGKLRRIEQIERNIWAAELPLITEKERALYEQRGFVKAQFQELQAKMQVLDQIQERSEVRTQDLGAAIRQAWPEDFDLNQWKIESEVAKDVKAVLEPFIPRSEEEVERLVQLEKNAWKTRVGVTLDDESIRARILGITTADGKNILPTPVIALRIKDRIEGAIFMSFVNSPQGLEGIPPTFGDLVKSHNPEGNTVIDYSVVSDPQTPYQLFEPLARATISLGETLKKERLLAYSRAEFFTDHASAKYGGETHKADLDLVFQDFAGRYPALAFEDYRKHFALTPDEITKLESDGFFDRIIRSRNKWGMKTPPSKNDLVRYFSLAENSFEDYARFHLNTIGDPFLLNFHQRLGAKIIGILPGARPGDRRGGQAAVIVEYALSSRSETRAMQEAVFQDFLARMQSLASEITESDWKRLGDEANIAQLSHLGFVVAKLIEVTPFNEFKERERRIMHTLRRQNGANRSAAQNKALDPWRNALGVEVLTGGKKGIGSSEDEILALTNEEGRLTGESAPKTEAHRDGLWHQTSHVHLRYGNKMLLQVRSAAKKLSAGKLQIGISGHINQGETQDAGVFREGKEEMGIDFRPEKLIAISLINAFKRSYPIAGGGQNNEFTTTYVYDLDVDELDQIRKNFNLNESDELWLVPFSVYEEMLQAPEAPEILSNSLRSLVKEQPELYARIRSELRSDGKNGESFAETKLTVFFYPFYLNEKRYSVGLDGKIYNDEFEAVSDSEEHQLWKEPIVSRAYNAFSRLIADSQEILIDGKPPVSLPDDFYYQSLDLSDIDENTFVGQLAAAKKDFETAFPIADAYRVIHSVEVTPDNTLGIFRIRTEPSRYAALSPEHAPLVEEAANDHVFRLFDFYLQGLLNKNWPWVAEAMKDEIKDLSISAGNGNLAIDEILREIESAHPKLDTHMRDFFLRNAGQKLKEYVGDDLFAEFKLTLIDYLMEGGERPAILLAQYLDAIYRLEQEIPGEQNFQILKYLRQTRPYFDILNGRYRHFIKAKNEFVKEPFPLSRFIPQKEKFKLADAASLEDFQALAERNKEQDFVLFYPRALEVPEAYRKKQGAVHASRRIVVFAYHGITYLVYRSISHSQMANPEQAGQWKRVEAARFRKPNVPLRFVKLLNEAAADLHPVFARRIEDLLSSGTIKLQTDAGEAEFDGWMLALGLVVNDEGEFLDSQYRPTGQEVDKRRYAYPKWLFETQKVFAKGAPAPADASRNTVAAKGAVKIGNINLDIFQYQDGSVEIVSSLGRKTYLLQDKLTIGRQSTQNIILNDNSVSRVHAAIRKTENKIEVRDYESTNGTHANGRRIGWQEKWVEVAMEPVSRSEVRQENPLGVLDPAVEAVRADTLTTYLYVAVPLVTLGAVLIGFFIRGVIRDHKAVQEIVGQFQKDIARIDKEDKKRLIELRRKTADKSGKIFTPYFQRKLNRRLAEEIQKAAGFWPPDVAKNGADLRGVLDKTQKESLGLKFWKWLKQAGQKILQAMNRTKTSAPAAPVKKEKKKAEAPAPAAEIKIKAPQTPPQQSSEADISSLTRNLAQRIRTVLRSKASEKARGSQIDVLTKELAEFDAISFDEEWKALRISQSIPDELLVRIEAQLKEIFEREKAKAREKITAKLKEAELQEALRKERIEKFKAESLQFRDEVLKEFGIQKEKAASALTAERVRIFAEFEAAQSGPLQERRDAYEKVKKEFAKERTNAAERMTAALRQAEASLKNREKSAKEKTGDPLTSFFASLYQNLQAFFDAETQFLTAEEEKLQSALAPHGRSITIEVLSHNLRIDVLEPRIEAIIQETDAKLANTPEQPFDQDAITADFQKEMEAEIEKLKSQLAREYQIENLTANQFSDLQTTINAQLKELLGLLRQSLQSADEETTKILTEWNAVKERIEQTSQRLTEDFKLLAAPKITQMKSGAEQAARYFAMDFDFERLDDVLDLERTAGGIFEGEHKKTENEMEDLIARQSGQLAAAIEAEERAFREKEEMAKERMRVQSQAAVARFQMKLREQNLSLDSLLSAQEALRQTLTTESRNSISKVKTHYRERLNEIKTPRENPMVRKKIDAEIARILQPYLEAVRGLSDDKVRKAANAQDFKNNETVQDFKAAIEVYAPLMTPEADQRWESEYIRQLNALVVRREELDYGPKRQQLKDQIDGMLVKFKALSLEPLQVLFEQPELTTLREWIETNFEGKERERQKAKLREALMIFATKLWLDRQTSLASKLHRERAYHPFKSLVVSVNVKDLIDPAAAEKHFKELIPKLKSSELNEPMLLARAYLHLAAAYMKQEKWSEAEPLIREALETDPISPDAGFYDAYLKRMTGKSQEARSVLVDLLTRPLPGSLKKNVQILLDEIKKSEVRADFASRPPSTQWLPLKYNDQEFAKVWFKPEKMPYVIIFRISDRAFLNAELARLLSVGNLMAAVKGAGITPADIQSWYYQGEIAVGEEEISNEQFTKQIPAIHDLDYLDIFVFLNSPKTPAAHEKIGLQQIPQDRWALFEKEWHFLLDQETTLKGLHGKLGQLGSQLSSEANKSYSAAVGHEAPKSFEGRWNQVKGKIRPEAEAVKNFAGTDHGPKSSPARKLLTTIYQNNILPKMPFTHPDEMNKAFKLLDDLKNERKAALQTGQGHVTKSQQLLSEASKTISQLKELAKSHRKRSELRLLSNAVHEAVFADAEILWLGSNSLEEEKIRNAAEKTEQVLTRPETSLENFLSQTEKAMFEIASGEERAFISQQLYEEKVRELIDFLKAYFQEHPDSKFRLALDLPAMESVLAHEEQTGLYAKALREFGAFIQDFVIRGKITGSSGRELLKTFKQLQIRFSNVRNWTQIPSPDGKIIPVVSPHADEALPQAAPLVWIGMTGQSRDPRIRAYGALLQFALAIVAADRLQNRSLQHRDARLIQAELLKAKTLLRAFDPSFQSIIIENGRAVVALEGIEASLRQAMLAAQQTQTSA